MSLVQQVNEASHAWLPESDPDWVAEVRDSLLVGRVADQVVRSYDGGLKGFIGKVVDVVKGLGTAIKNSAFGQWLRGNPNDDDEGYDLPDDDELAGLPEDLGKPKTSDSCVWPDVPNDGTADPARADAYCKQIWGPRFRGIYECVSGRDCCTAECWDPGVSGFEGKLQLDIDGKDFDF